ncbi:Jouberin [Araneus ventricosus]|uniref:Jouberin n=1 Tax=Araneus ventricosus TaxID=182803 RepID=A0A4Y2CWD4_ARAVE|nr:Jouberin [Araneus ventricosus]
MKNKGDRASAMHSNDGVVKITVHHCELKLEKLLVQPVVYMHVVDSSHECYVKKQDSKRAVTSFYENQRGDIDYILPIMTQPCAVQGKKSQLLCWEESFVLNENMEHLLKKEISTILFFEVIDLVPLTFTKYHYERLNENGMQKLAWAFLKVLGSNNVVNTGSKLRLQLFKPHISRKKKACQLEVFKWWSSKPRIPLPASLYISFERHDISTIEPALRSMLPLQEETGSSVGGKGVGTSNESALHSPNDNLSVSDSKNNEIKWSRKEGEPYKIPSHHSLVLESATSCQILKFSSLGRLLVAGCGAAGQYSLFIFEIPSGKFLHKMFAHSDVIYDFDWSENDERLLSASADYSVKLWNAKSWNVMSLFPHPSFVYAAKFQPSMKNNLVTGCYDHVIRIWTFHKSAQLLQELEGHNSSVNALCWHKKNINLFSADTTGEIKMWRNPSYQRNSSKDLNNYVLDRDLCFSEIKGVSVNKLVTNINEDILFLFCGDGSVRLINISIGRIFTCFECFPKYQSTAVGCCSPCGNLLFLCSDNGCVQIWSRKSSKITESLSDAFHRCQLTSIDYHPLDHILALSTSEDGGYIHVYTCEESDELCEAKELDASEKGCGTNSPDSSSTLTENRNERKDSNTNTLFSSSTPMKNKNELKNYLTSHEKPRTTSKRNPSKSYFYNAETSSDEGFARLSLDAKRDSTEYESAEYAKPEKYYEESGNSESFTAISAKSGHLNVIPAPDKYIVSDSHASGSQISDSGYPDSLQRSSKRSQRRRKLREMNKSNF